MAVRVIFAPDVEVPFDIATTFELLVVQFTVWLFALLGDIVAFIVVVVVPPKYNVDDVLLIAIPVTG